MFLKKYSCSHGLEKCYDCLLEHHDHETSVMIKALEEAECSGPMFETDEDHEKWCKRCRVLKIMGLS